MVLIVGGKGQGKESYTVNVLNFTQENISPAQLDERPVLAHLEDLVRKWLEEEKSPMDFLEQLCQKQVILCEEIGCGIVPMDAFERQWREETGRLCQALAQRAEHVIQMVCGIARVIK